jgi:glycosyltransferase involved in cell wall biosynthesis
VETWVCRRAAHVAVLCNGLQQDLTARGIAAEKLTVIPNGVDVQAFRPCEPDLAFLTHWNLAGKKVVGFLGSFFRYEGLDLLVKAVARLARTRSDVALLLVGGGEMDVALKEQIKRLGVENAVVILEQIAHERIPSVYAAIDILAYPRYSMRLTELVTPLKPLEALAMEKVVIASDVGGHRELIQHGQTGFLFAAGDVSACAAGLERLLDDVTLCRTLAIQGATWVREERSWERTTAGYSDIYAKVLGKTC